MTEINQGKRYNIWQPFILAVMLAVGVLLGYKLNEKADPQLLMPIDKSHDVTIGRVEEIIRFIDSKYVDTISNDKLMDEAIDAILANLDPHSIYLSPTKLKGVNESMDGSFKGIGIESFFIHDTVNILSVVKDSPADKGGIKQFDQIIAIDDTLVAGQKRAFDDIRAMLRKDGKSTVKVEINRKGQALIKLINIGEIPIHTADIGSMINDSIGIITIDQFSSNTYKEFMEVLEHLVEDQKMKHLIIDLRGNPGGYLPQATKILNQLFKEKDRMLVYTVGRNRKTISEYKTNGKPFFLVNKIAVLVDENSASGSEIIAGALQDWDRATIIGRKTYGKGLVQEQFNLSNGGAIRLTTARYYLPTGRSIQKPVTSLDDYYNEIESRYDSGQLFIKDTLRKQNSEVFKTLEKGKNVFDKGGIEPDVFIPADSAYYDSNYLHLSANVMEYLFIKMKEGKYSSSPLPDADTKVIAEGLIEEYKSKDSNKNFKLPSKEYNLLLSEIKLAYEYIVSNGDRSLQNRLKLKEDRYIDAAVNEMKKKQ